MCGRYTLRTSPEDIGAYFDADLETVPELPRYNIAPTQPIAAMILRDDARTLVTMEWGLLPANATEKKYRPINAKCETADSKWPFAIPFEKRRCVVIADGFFEWAKLGSNRKQPFLFQRHDTELIAFAGVWDVNSRTGEDVRSCAILTTKANSLMAPIHDRMPLMIAREDIPLWLDRDVPSKALETLYRPWPAEEMTATEVSPIVNSWKNDQPACVKPVLTLFD